MNNILLEYYAGRPKELIKCEGYLAEIVKDIKRDHQNVSPTRTRHVHRDSKAARNLEEALADFFKVEKVTIYWQSHQMNAGTWKPMAMTIPDRKSKYMAGQKSTLKMYICVDENLVYKAGLNEAELLAFILHEIGHNFYYCPIMVACEAIYVVCTLPFGLISGAINKGLALAGNYVADAIKRHIPFVYNLMNVCVDFLNEFNEIFKPITMGLNSLVVMSGQYATQSPLVALPAYGGEKGADSFAAKYGYGPEMASGLHKCEEPEHMLASRMFEGTGSFGTVMRDLTNLSCDFVGAMILDPHPNTNQRAAATLKKLEADLKKGDYPPAMKKDLEAEIKRMREVYETLNDPKRGGDPAVRKAWYTFVDDMTGGYSDLRELLNFYYDSYRF